MKVIENQTFDMERSFHVPGSFTTVLYDFPKTVDKSSLPA